MKTFRFTVPEPSHGSSEKMGPRERVFWQRVRRRGGDWYVGTKGLAFLVAYPVLGHLALGWELRGETAAEGLAAGLVCGTLMWIRNERRYRRTLEDLPGYHPDQFGD